MSTYGRLKGVVEITMRKDVLVKGRQQLMQPKWRVVVSDNGLPLHLVTILFQLVHRLILNSSINQHILSLSIASNNNEREKQRNKSTYASEAQISQKYLHEDLSKLDVIVVGCSGSNLFGRQSVVVAQQRRHVVVVFEARQYYGQLHLLRNETINTT